MSQHEKLLVKLCPVLNPVLAHTILTRLPLAQLLTEPADSLQASQFNMDAKVGKLSGKGLTVKVLELCSSLISFKAFT
jgi:hypothetical protein